MIMDPLSIVGAIVAVGQATAMVAKCSVALYQISCKAGVLAEEVELFASHVDVFGSTISGAHSTSRDHYMNNRKSITISKLHEYATLNKLAGESTRLMERVEALQRRFEVQETGLDIVARIWRIFKKEERKDICLWMDRLQISFLLIMHQVTYEGLQQRASDPSSLYRELFDFRQEMKKHKRLIQTHKKSMRVLRGRLEGPNHRKSRQYEEDHNTAFNNIEDMLLGLGKDMVTNRVSTRSPTSSATTGSRSSEGFTHCKVRGANTHGSPRTTKHPPSQRRVPKSSRTESVKPTTRLDILPHSAAVPPNRQQTPTPERLSLSTSTSSIMTKETPGPFKFRHWNEGNYMAVRASDSILYVNLHHNSEILEGYVNSNVGPTSAILNPKFPENVMSQPCVKNLGLRIEYFHFEDDKDVEGGDDLDDRKMDIDFGNGHVQPVIGRVVFYWRKGQDSTHSKPMKVSCLVCEYVPLGIPLVFGESFLERRAYWDE